MYFDEETKQYPYKDEELKGIRLTDETYQIMKKLVKKHEQQEKIDIKNEPYLISATISTHAKYNKDFGDHRICECGHEYHRHFDSYENMFPCGCKYCECFDFKEKIN